VISFTRKLAWAGSNVYWEDGNWNGGQGRLTFAPAGTAFDDSKQTYLGVYFFWGSLVGISPKFDTENQDTYKYNASTTPSFWPIYNSADPETSGWNSTTGTAWSSFPYLTSTSGNFGEDTNYFNSLPNGGTSLYSSQTGDICRYLGHTGAAPDGYRMPTYNEIYYGKLNNTSTVTYDASVWDSAPIHNRWTKMAGSTWANVPAAVGQSYQGGTYPMPSGANHGDVAVFPATGWMEEPTGDSYTPGARLRGLGNSGHYWTSSAHKKVTSTNIDKIYFFVFGSAGVQDRRGQTGDAPDIGPSRPPYQTAFSVRCVKN
jgi:hypothetical protein